MKSNGFEAFYFLCRFRKYIFSNTFSSILNSEYLHSTKNIFIIVKTKIEINNIDICITKLCAPLHSDEILFILYYSMDNYNKFILIPKFSKKQFIVKATAYKNQNAVV